MGCTEGVDERSRIVDEDILRAVCAAEIENNDQSRDLVHQVDRENRPMREVRATGRAERVEFSSADSRYRRVETGGDECDGQHLEER
jgi:hypothetical protein